MNMKYCCKMMKQADEEELIDYCPGHFTSIDTENEAWAIYYCPFCGKSLKGTERSVKRIAKYCGKKSRKKG